MEWFSNFLKGVWNIDASTNVCNLESVVLYSAQCFILMILIILDFSTWWRHFYGITCMKELKLLQDVDIDGELPEKISCFEGVYYNYFSIGML